MLIGHGENAARMMGIWNRRGARWEFEIFKVPLDSSEETADLATFKTIFIKSLKSNSRIGRFICWINYGLMGENLVCVENGVCGLEEALF